MGEATCRPRRGERRLRNSCTPCASMHAARRTWQRAPDRGMLAAAQAAGAGPWVSLGRLTACSPGAGVLKHHKLQQPFRAAYISGNWLKLAAAAAPCECGIQRRGGCSVVLRMCLNMSRSCMNACLNDVPRPQLCCYRRHALPPPPPKRAQRRRCGTGQKDLLCCVAFAGPFIQYLHYV